MESTKDAFKKTLSELDTEQKDQDFDFFRQEQLELEEESNEEQKFATKTKDIEEEKAINPTLNTSKQETDTDEEDEKWINQSYDGKLAVDVYQTANDIVIKSTIAGCSAEDLDISINNEVITVKGVRTPDEEVDEEDYFFRECYWGGFSRSIILPMEVDASACEASIQNGILTIRLPKANNRTKRISVKSLDEETETNLVDEVM